MAAVIKGTGVVWSVGEITFAAGGVITATAGTDHLTQSATFERTSEVARIKDTGGTVKTVVFSGNMKTLRITVVPAGSSITNAIASGREFMPALGGLVKVTDSNGSLASTETNYYVLNATQNRTVDGTMTIDLVLENGDEGTDLSSTVS